MKRRGNANAWLLGILVFVLGAVAIDVTRQMTTKPKQPPVVDPVAESRPPFKEGEVAPDFVLKDENGSKRALSEYIHKDTLLAFTCGCNNCKEMLTYLAKLEKKLGDKAPAVVNITSMPATAKDAWIRDTKLKQSMMFAAHDEQGMEEEKKQFNGTAPMDYYKGHPCPRLFRVDAKRTVRWIGKSPREYDGGPMGMELMSMDLARELGFHQAIDNGAASKDDMVAPLFREPTKVDPLKPIAPVETPMAPKQLVQ